MRSQPGSRQRGPRYSRRPWRWWSRQARRQRPSASSITVDFTIPRAASSTAVGFTAPRAASSAAVGLTAPRAALVAAATEAAAAAAAATVRTAPWRVGTIECLFLLRPARTLVCRVSSDTPRAAEHVFPSASVHCPAGRSAC